MKQQHGDDHHQFDDGRRELQQDHAHDGLDGVAAALEHAGEPAGLALEMKAQRQEMHVLEGEHGEPAHRVHRHFGENAVAPLREQRHDDAHAAVSQRQHDRRGEHPDQPIVRIDRRGTVAGERVGRPFEGERHRHRGEFGEEQKHGGEDHARFEIGPVGRPDIRPQLDQRGQQGPAILAPGALAFWFSCGRCNSLIEAFFGSSCF